MTGAGSDPWILPAADWANAVAEALAGRIAARPDLVLCLPTGSTPRPVYDRLADALARAATSLAGVRIVLLDEYLGLPVGHPIRCDVQLRQRLPERSAEFVTFDVDGPDPATACAAYDAAIGDRGGLDLVVLGLGTNGHIGMNEPGTRPDAPTRVIELAPSTMAAARAYGADPPPTHGVTLGLAGILAAREVWLLVSGARKAAILREMLEGPVTTDVPASLLRGHPGLRIIADDASRPDRRPKPSDGPVRAALGPGHRLVRDARRVARLDPAPDGVAREQLVNDHRRGPDDAGQAAE